MEILSFPALNINIPLNRVAFTVFGKDIYFYGIIVAFGLLLGSLYAFINAKKEGISDDDFLDILLVAVPSSVICARIYYVAAMWNDYKNNIADVFKIWEGGIAIYGAIIGGVISVLICCRFKKISFLKVADICSPALFIGQIIGRFGNFVNMEAYGYNTDLPWGMTSETIKSELLALQKKGINVNPDMCVHPTFLYESLWNALGLILILILKKHKRHSGEMFAFYIAWYGLGRFFIEGLRTDSLMFYGLRISQIIGIISFVIAASMGLYLHFGRNRKSI